MVSAIDRSQPKGVKPKMRERRLRNGVNWQGALKQNRVKQEIGVSVRCVIHTIRLVDTALSIYAKLGRSHYMRHSCFTVFLSTNMVSLRSCQNMKISVTYFHPRTGLKWPEGGNRSLTLLFL